MKRFLNDLLEPTIAITHVLDVRIFPIFAFVTFIYVLLVNKAVFFAWKIPKRAYKGRGVSGRVTAISLGAFALQVILTQLYSAVSSRLAMGCGLRLDPAVLYVFLFFSVCVCGFINYRLNLRFTLRRIWEEPGRSKPALGVISALTSPLIFWLPLDAVILKLFW